MQFDKLVNFVQVARKFMVALVAAAGVLLAALQDQAITLDEATAIFFAFAGAFGVYVARNKSTK